MFATAHFRILHLFMAKAENERRNNTKLRFYLFLQRHNAEFQNLYGD
jgi:hypothetical protein